jgi:Ca2+-binding EF-hand superfamily protein
VRRYDVDNDGRISKDDLFGALKMTVAVASDGGGGTPTPNATTPAAADDQHATLDEDGLREVVENTFDEMAPGLSHIDFDAFVKVVTLPGCELLSKMTMQF